jgi:hypothetical protein
MSSKSALNTGAVDHLPTSNTRVTRSTTKGGTQQTGTNTPQLATLEKKKAKARDSKETEEAARKTLIEEKVLNEGAEITHQSVTRALTVLTQKHAQSAPPGLIKAMQAITTLLQEASNTKSQLMPVLETLTQKLGEHVEKSLQEEITKLSGSLKDAMADQCKAMTPPEAVAEAVAMLKQVASDMSKTIGEATTATTQINDTTFSYKQALLQAAPQATQTHQTYHMQERTTYPDPRILRDMDRRAKQILIDTIDPEVVNLSLAELKEKVRTSIASVTNPPPPQNVEILEVSKLKKGGITVLFGSKEIIDWMKDRDPEFGFLSAFSRDAELSKRSYLVLVPRVPLTFDPSNDTHLREVEEANALPTGVIQKARWIKPIYRRAPGQRAAHAIFTLDEITVANRCIRDGIYVCGLRIRPSRLKHEPLQCMKCRKWGHFANVCSAEVDTCGTCGGEHRTKECTRSNKIHCVSCNSDSHPSWDRDCPEFLQRRVQYDENYPENGLTYFPTGEDWTLTPQPSKIPFADKFPKMFNIAALPPPHQNNHMQVPRQTGRQRRRREIKLPPNQGTMDRYVTVGSSQPRAGGQENGMASTRDAEEADMSAPYYDCDIGQEPQPSRWD